MVINNVDKAVGNSCEVWYYPHRQGYLCSAYGGLGVVC